MKARIIIALLTFGFIPSLLAQEYDDMYFNASDREALRAEKMSLASFNSNTKKGNLASDPADYSSRDINPEYSSRSQYDVTNQEEDYYVNNYNYQSSPSTQYSNWNNQYNNWYSNPMYSSSWHSPYYNSWASPYYSPYNSWNNSWYDPYWDPYGSGYSWYGGSSWSYGWGRPYLGSFYGPSWGWGSSYYARNWYYPRNTVIIVDNYSGGRKVTYGRRSSRSGNHNYSTRPTRTTPSTGGTGGTYNPRPSAGGRTAAGDSDRGETYNNRSWSRPSSDVFGTGRTPASGRDNGSSNENTKPTYSPSRSTNSDNTIRYNKSYSPSDNNGVKIRSRGDNKSEQRSYSPSNNSGSSYSPSRSNSNSGRSYSPSNSSSSPSYSPSPSRSSGGSRGRGSR